MLRLQSVSILERKFCPSSWRKSGSWVCFSIYNGMLRLANSVEILDGSIVNSTCHVSALAALADKAENGSSAQTAIILKNVRIQVKSPA